MWQLVVTHYRPDLQEKKSLTPRLMDVAQDALQVSVLSPLLPPSLHRLSLSLSLK